MLYQIYGLRLMSQRTPSFLSFPQSLKVISGEATTYTAWIQFWHLRILRLRGGQEHMMPGMAGVWGQGTWAQWSPSLGCILLVFLPICSWIGETGADISVIPRHDPNSTWRLTPAWVGSNSYFHFTNEFIKAQGDEATCRRSHDCQREQTVIIRDQMNYK